MANNLAAFMHYKRIGRGKKELKNRSCSCNGRSADFTAPSGTIATGCLLACNYCYVARRSDIGNPLIQSSNIDKVWLTIRNHAKRQGTKTEANQCDPVYYTYDIGENTDALLEPNIPLTNYLIERMVHETDNAKPTFATKVAHTANSKLIAVPRDRARIRPSLMPQRMSSLVEHNTSKISKRIQGMNTLYESGYEVHVNFSPVIIYDGWQQDYIDLFHEIRDTVTPQVLAQLKAEVIFLTHSDVLHERNMPFFPDAEQILWKPQLQEKKWNQRGKIAYRYRARTIKKQAIAEFKQLLDAHLPECSIRYIF